MIDQQKALGRLRASGEGRTVETWEGYVFNLQRNTVTVRGQDIPLTAKEFGLALLLFRNLSQAMSRDVIMRAVWGYGEDETSRTLKAHISQIRRRLGLNPKNGLLLTSVYRFGYRLERLDAWNGAEPRGVDGLHGRGRRAQAATQPKRGLRDTPSSQIVRAERPDLILHGEQTLSQRKELPEGVRWVCDPGISNHGHAHSPKVARG